MHFLNGISNQANTYGRYENKDKIIQASKEYGGRTFDRTKRLDSATKQSIKAYYNSYCDGTYKGDIRKLYDDVLLYNGDDKIKQYDKQVDLSVFPSNIEEIELKEVVNEDRPNQKSKPIKEEEKYFYNESIEEEFDEDVDLAFFDDNLKVTRNIDSSDFDDVDFDKYTIIELTGYEKDRTSSKYKKVISLNELNDDDFEDEFPFS